MQTFKNILITKYTGVIHCITFVFAVALLRVGLERKVIQSYSITPSYINIEKSIKRIIYNIYYSYSITYVYLLLSLATLPTISMYNKSYTLKLYCITFNT